MEAATLSNPQRKCNVVPVQKSLSLPSYARASGEGIDHRLIFAALEQKEKVRRKSRIFAREKTARQNIFCLPISSGTKCRETSLSSDTSCSSLEYQKAKTPKPSKEQVSCEQQKASKKEPHVNERVAVKTNQYEISSNSVHRDVDSRNPNPCETKPNSSSLKANDHWKGQRSPVDTLRLNVGSSDSMERSSRSSNDSLTRKERLVAIKARVEAAREKYGESSSEEESRSSITRYNSDGVIHRTVREVKSKSSRMEKRIRRRSQDEWGIKKANRKNNLSLCLNSVDDGVKLQLERPSDITEDCHTPECKTDYCPSPSFPDMLKKNYFSDFPSKENVARIVQARIKHIEEEERKRRNSFDFREKIKLSSRQSPQPGENSSPMSAERRSHYAAVEKISSNSDIMKCSSPSPRSSQAPTPPPRSPKSMTFVNKAFIQHQNSSLLSHDNHSLERKILFQANIPAVSHSRFGDRLNSKSEATINDSRTVAQILDNSTERRKIRELLNSRRKTCGYFDFLEKSILSDLSSPSAADAAKSLLSETPRVAYCDTQQRSSENKGYFSSNEAPNITSEDLKKRFWRNKWEENERKQEFMFNSLESRKKGNSPSWLKWRDLPNKSEACFCHLITGDKSNCTCNVANKNHENRGLSLFATKVENGPSKTYFNHLGLEIQHSSSRLSKSEANIAAVDQTKSSSLESKFENLYGSLRRQYDKTPSNENSSKYNSNVEENFASANLESAMEELESVYRSLKFSSDNLSERNSASNASLNEDDGKLSKNEISVNTCKKEVTVQQNTPLWENTSRLVHGNVKVIHDKKYPEYLNSFVRTPPNLSSSKISENSVSKTLCIDELFNDLTRQLDIEQKLLKESRDNRSHNQISSVKNGKSELPSYNSPLESIVSIRKELYNNLQTGSQVHKSPVKATGVEIEDPRAALTKKKYKAVRSLSANISYLMATATTDSSSIPKTSDASSCSLETCVIEKSSPKHYEHVTLEPPKLEVKREMSLKQPGRTLSREKLEKTDEIRHIRVSMDSNVPPKPVMKNSIPDCREYPRLSSAVCKNQALSKPEVPNRLCHDSSTPSSISKESVDILDETGLEKLLNTLLNEVPEPKHSSLLLSKDAGPMTPPPPVAAGKSDNVKYKRNILPPKMDSYVAAKAKNKDLHAELNQRSLSPEEVSHKVKTDFCQNNAHLNQMSFIPVYSKNTMCHNFSTRNEYESKCHPHEGHTSSMKVPVTNSPPLRQKCSVEQNERLSARLTKTHIRRRSVGFEDMTSLSSCYGYNFTNDRRIHNTATQNFNISSVPPTLHGNIVNSDNDLVFGKVNQSENCVSTSTLNWNTQITSGENENDHLCDRNERPAKVYKDKSSKRKSSLNRLDFFDLPVSNIGNACYQQDSLQQKSSSSDEESESRLQQQNSEFLINNSKRKHNSTSLAAPSSLQRKVTEVPLSTISGTNKSRSSLPKSLQSNHMKHRQRRLKQPTVVHVMQKLSHSAGELESLTDFSEVSGRNKVCLSAQECDSHEHHSVLLKSANTDKVLKKTHSISSMQDSSNSSKYLSKDNSYEKASQVNVKKELMSNGKLNKFIDASKDAGQSVLVFSSSVSDSVNPGQDKVDSPIEALAECISSEHNEAKEVISDFQDVKTDMESVKPNIKISKESGDQEIESSAMKLENLELSCEDDLGNVEIYVSADDNSDFLGSDSEKRPNSILRKKCFEEKKELHSILKPPPDDKCSKTPHSILKHRESSEEKDVWQQSDLHSILKKSTSEDESCNSGPDIRPILKVSTDEESPSGSMKPRPILKKRTSFSDECSYASFPSGELKPILKKKTPLPSEEQPKPILKSRRKSEDTRSTMSEFIASRPRAYSADMGVKSNHETHSDGFELKKEDFYKNDCQDL